MTIARISFVLPVCMSLAMIGCQSPSNGFTSRDEEAIRAASKQYMQSETAGDPDACVQFSSPDAVYMPSNSQVIQGRAALAAWDRGVAPGLQLQGTIHEIIGRGDLAIVRGSYVVTQRSGQGSPARDYTGNYVEIWQRQQNGSWQIIRNIWNSDQP